MSSSGSNPARPTRFARLYSDGCIGIERASTDFFTARQRLFDNQEDTDIELLEVELRVVRSYGKPQEYCPSARAVTCPTCGEEIQFDDPTLQAIRAGIQEWSRKSESRLKLADVERMIGCIAEALK